MQPEKAEEIRAWLRKAFSDLRAAGVDLAADPPLVGDALFHCQPAVEKALKAFLTAHDAPLPGHFGTRESGRSPHGRRRKKPSLSPGKFMIKEEQERLIRDQLNAPHELLGAFDDSGNFAFIRSGRR